jgi:hypothetical protein
MSTMLNASLTVPAGAPETVKAGGVEVHFCVPAQEKLRDMADAADGSAIEHSRVKRTLDLNIFVSPRSTKTSKLNHSA